MRNSEFELFLSFREELVSRYEDIFLRVEIEILKTPLIFEVLSNIFINIRCIFLGLSRSEKNVCSLIFQ